MAGERINYSTSARMKRRISDIAKSKGQSMNDVIEEAVKEHVNRLDANYSAPDLVADRLAQIFTTLIAMNNQLQELRHDVAQSNQERG